MKKSIFLRFLLVVLGNSLLVALLVFFIVNHAVRTHELRQTEDHLLRLAKALSPEIVRQMRAPNPGFSDWVKLQAEESGLRLTILDINGRVLADSEEAPERMENHRYRSEIRSALAGGVGTAVRFSDTLNMEMLYLAISMHDGEKILGVVRLSLAVQRIDRMIAGIQHRALAVLTLVVLAAILLAFWFSRRLVLPIRQLARLSKQVAGGDMSGRVRLDGQDELKQLADNFNEMVGRQAELIADLTYSRGRLEAVVAGINEGLLLLAEDGRILLANDDARKICDGDLVIERLYWEVIRNPAIHSAIEGVRRGENRFAHEVEISGKIYLVTYARLEGECSIVVLFHDITEMKRLEAIKKEFMVNFSHELRTPLTAIKGYLETIGEEGIESHSNYLEIIRRHTERLIHLVSDMLALAELEEKRQEFIPQTIRLQEFLENIFRLFARRAAEKGLALKLEAAPGLDLTSVTLKGDPFRLEQLFVNLIDNSLNYTDRGEVRLRIEQDGGRILFRLSDTGIGIPPQHLPRIFERFYVVDKARSREKGGTGLGLAIVKHVVQLHRGRIDVESEPGRGTTFRIELSLA